MRSYELGHKVIVTYKDYWEAQNESNIPDGLKLTLLSKGDLLSYKDSFNDLSVYQNIRSISVAAIIGIVVNLVTGGNAPNALTLLILILLLCVIIFSTIFLFKINKRVKETEKRIFSAS